MRESKGEAEASHGASAAAMAETRPAVNVVAADLSTDRDQLAATTRVEEPSEGFSRFLPSPQKLMTAGAPREPQYSMGGASALEDAYNAARE